MVTTVDQREHVINDNTLKELVERAVPASSKAFQTALIVLTPRAPSREDREPESLENATWEDAAFY